MRPGLFDESKIIKKEDQQKVEESKEKLPELKKGEEIFQDGPPVTYANEKAIAKLEIGTNDDTSTQIINDIQKQSIVNPSKETKVVKTQPVFLFERDKNTRKVKTVSNVQNTTIDIDIPKDQLTLIYVNTLKRINEIKVDLEVLKLMISEKDNFYLSSKLNDTMQELEFNNKKMEILEKLIK
jgi:hypothetical protein